MPYKIREPHQEYTFSYFFSLSNSLADIVGDFGYTTELVTLPLPKGKIDPARAKTLQQSYHETLPYITLTTEMARREFYISPLLRELLHIIKVQIDVELPLHVKNKLRGTLDYLIRGTQNLLVIEAKRGDIEAGFNQLAVELIAIDERNLVEAPLLFGAVSSGSTWRFGILDRAKRHIQQDFNQFSLPQDTGELLKILVGILNGKPN